MAAPLLLPAPPPPPRIQFGMNSLIMRTMIDVTIEDGTHATLHSLMNMEKRGALGSAVMNGMKNEWSAGQRTRAKQRYALGHHENVSQARAVPAIYMPFGDSAATRAAVAGCCSCFRYLCEKKVIRPEGFFPTLESFLFHAQAGNNQRLMEYIIQELPDHFMFEDQDIMAPGAAALDSPLNVCSSHERPFRMLVAKMQRLEASSPARFQILVSRSVGSLALRGGEMLLSQTSQFNISKFIDVELAQQLALWGMHPGSWVNAAGDENIFSQMFRFNNPHRCSMMQWLGKSTYQVGYNGFTQINRGIRIAAPLAPIPDLYPPWGVAIWMGDIAAAIALSRSDRIDPVATGFPGVPGAAPIYLPGRAAVEHFTPTHLRLLTHWLRCACWEMEQNDYVIELTVILEHLLIFIEYQRFHLKTAPVPAGVPVAAFRAANRRKVKAETDIAISMVHVLIGIPFRYIESNDNDEMVRSSVLEDEDYQDWIATVKRNKRQNRIYQDCVAVLAALERPPDRRSLRSLTDQVMDWD